MHSQLDFSLCVLNMFISSWFSTCSYEHKNKLPFLYNMYAFYSHVCIVLMHYEDIIFIVTKDVSSALTM
jgi:hypothetical protein